MRQKAGGNQAVSEVGKRKIRGLRVLISVAREICMYFNWENMWLERNDVKTITLQGIKLCPKEQDAFSSHFFSFCLYLLFNISFLLWFCFVLYNKFSGSPVYTQTH